MTCAEQLAHYVYRVKLRNCPRRFAASCRFAFLDSVGCAVGALGADLISRVREVVDELGGNEKCTLIGGGRSSPDRAAFHNSALVCYLDFNGSYLAKGESCHPSDNLGPCWPPPNTQGAAGANC
jgi:2-methylcitrate dehydratase